MATYNYKGTRITGTSTGAKKFPKSKVANAKHNQLYLNKQTGHVYVCDTPGKPSVATWKYLRTDIIGKPNIAPSAMSTPTRNGNKYTDKWKIPSNLVSAKNGRRAERLVVDWFLGIAGKDPKFHRSYANEKTTSNTFTFTTVTIQKKTYTRNSFYPLTNLKLYYLTCRVRGYNAKGEGKAAEKTYTFKPPRNPTIDAPTINPANGEVSFVVKTNAGADMLERYDTRYIVTIENTRTGKTWQHANGSSTSTEFTLSYDASDYQQLDTEQYIRITVEAWARGYAGDSAHVTRSYTFAFPAQVTITGVDAVRSSAGKATVLIATNSSSNHPVDQVRLEYLANTEYMNADDIPGEASWTPTDIVDDAQSTALAIPVTNLIPEAGKRTWIRVKSFHGIEAVLLRYSDYAYLPTLETVPPTAADDAVKILSYASGDDGRSAVVLMGWNVDGTDDSTGTELTWSEDRDAWRSTAEPSVYNFTYSDGEITRDGTTYHDSAEVIIKGLDEGTPVFIRARRYLESDVTTYGAYSDTVTVTPNVAPSGVVLTAPTYVARGSSIPFTWTYGGGGTQRAWQLLTESGTVIASGENAMGSYNLSAARANSLAVDGVLTARIEVATGADFVASPEMAIQIIDAPTLAVTVPATITAQTNNTFAAVSNRECALLVVISADGSTGDTPIGLRYQPDGETVWSGLIHPTWSESNDVLSATVSIPGGLDLIDKASYTVSATALDESTGLRSAEATGRFEIAWAHQAIAPGDYVQITPNDYLDDDGVAHKTATIAWELPTTITDPDTQETREGVSASDVVDVYRLTGDGAVLIGTNYATTDTVTDEYAPFGNDLTLYYRIAVRTADGDIEYSDVEYVLDGDMMRFDWPGGVLELPYDISLSDAYAKDKAVRKHLDGTTSIHYNEGVTRTGKQSTRLVRLMSQDDVLLTRALAHYAGNVFIRLPDGTAYEGNVEIDDMSTTGVIEAISISTTEAATTAAYMLPIPEAEESGEGE